MDGNQAFPRRVDSKPLGFIGIAAAIHEPSPLRIFDGR
ncbi:hypothetical protein FHS27_002207 [Rhodopirellula rubra]|uniref:Uncharacterized protein n=1 Tax=Aporhodopirellula rubra TaxID=980271 RepID=A0A7W5DYE3_9BACT|nr:hypothetical protein [Aporhodopirellula rubra]